MYFQWKNIKQNTKIILKILFIKLFHIRINLIEQQIAQSQGNLRIQIYIDYSKTLINHLSMNLHIIDSVKNKKMQVMNQYKFYQFDYKLMHTKNKKSFVYGCKYYLKLSQALIHQCILEINTKLKSCNNEFTLNQNKFKIKIFSFPLSLYQD